MTSTLILEAQGGNFGQAAAVAGVSSLVTSGLGAAGKMLYPKQLR